MFKRFSHIAVNKIISSLKASDKLTKKENKPSSPTRHKLANFGWAIWFRNKAIPILDEMIAQIRASPTDTMGWFDPDIKAAWQNPLPITPTSIKSGNLPLDHQAWVLTPNPW